MTKICSKCKQLKEINEFYKHKEYLGGYRSQCKDCSRKGNELYRQIHKEEIKKYMKKYQKTNKKQLRNFKNKYYQTNKEKILKQHETYHQDHKKEIEEYQKEYRQKYELRLKKQNKIYRKRNKEKIKKRKNKYIKKRRKIDVNFKILANLRSRVYCALKGNPKLSTTMKLISCSILKLRQYLQKQFKKGMTWENYGKWHIDHIKPCCTFDLSKPSEQRKCFHYKNLQPLWAEENWSKGGKRWIR